MLNRYYLTSKSNNSSSSSSSKMLATNDVIKSQYDTLLDKQSMNSWLPLPHPCVFTSNWSSFHQFDLIKNYPLSCLYSKHIYESNSTLKESCLDIHKLGSMTKESTLNNDHDIEVKKVCETDLNMVEDENITNEYPNKEYEILPKEKKPILSIHKSTTPPLPPPPPPHHHHPLSMKKFTIRETTNLLKSWLNNHRYNPYPTKNEKIKLSLITHLSLTQISTWFANARRRLKKENQMTWIPKIRHHRIITTNSIHLNSHYTTNTNNTTDTTDNHNNSISGSGSNNNNTDQLPKVTSNLRSTIMTDYSIHPVNNNHHHHLKSLNSQLIFKYFLNKNTQQQGEQVQVEEGEERRQQQQSGEQEEEEGRRQQKEDQEEEEEEEEERRRQHQQQQERRQEEQQCFQIQDKLAEYSNILLNDINLSKIKSIIDKNTIENNNNDLWNHDDNTKLIHMNPLIYQKNIDQYRLYCKSLESSELSSSSSSSSVESTTTTINSSIVIDPQRNPLNNPSKIWSVADVIDV
ncbi:unnamed protein product [Schistosoma rodhaini]|nr:unnamed protein product [Schistosoma rodhaini]